MVGGTPSTREYFGSIKGGGDMINVSVEDVADPVLKDIVLNENRGCIKKTAKGQALPGNDQAGR